MTAPPHGLYLVGVDYPEWGGEKNWHAQAPLNGFWNSSDPG